MTAVEWYKKEIVELAVQLQHQKIDLYEFLVEIQKREEQAKEMEKQQIYEAFYDGEENAHKYKSSPSLYYNETYGSKGSDETKTNNMKTGTSSLMDSHLVDFSNKNAHLIKSNSTTSSQTEISDEEIKNIVDKFEQFLDREISLNLSPKDTIERIKWYYTQYFKLVEISDEEIEKVAKEYVLYNDQKRAWVIEGMKLYREQLKK